MKKKVHRKTTARTGRNNLVDRLEALTVRLDGVEKLIIETARSVNVFGRAVEQLMRDRVQSAGFPVPADATTHTLPSLDDAKVVLFYGPQDGTYEVAKRLQEAVARAHRKPVITIDLVTDKDHEVARSQLKHEPGRYIDAARETGFQVHVTGGLLARDCGADATVLAAMDAKGITWMMTSGEVKTTGLARLP